MTALALAALGEALAAHEHGDFTRSARLAGDILDQDATARARKDDAFVIMPKVGHIERHCETLRPNVDCPYLDFGCYGCSAPGPYTKERQERARVENAALGLLDTADGIDRMAAAAGHTRDEQIAHLDPVARAAARLVVVGMDQEVADGVALKIVEHAGRAGMEHMVDAMCKMIRRPAPPMLGPGIPGRSQGVYTDGQISPDATAWAYISPRFESELSPAEIRRTANKHEPGRRDGKRAQRNMLKPWAKKWARR